MMNRKPCNNVHSATYSGLESSPLHFGLSAEGYELEFKKEGNDKMLWKVKIKNNKKVWVRTSENEPKFDTGSNVQNLTDIQEQEIKPSTSTSKIHVEKKLTDYNLFLTYRLHEEKKQCTDSKIDNKKFFTQIVAEWKQIDKKSQQFQNIMTSAREHNRNKK